ncbi:2Fe-2S iron-sulfur cluster-binding protein [Thalassotalea psychrophila]|uniref:2Fe-2S iron-sulfur cluster-binding protein n=1 Tax=Thalassotalea psychrophila TaxID=3065647 RepID=A0ABY9TR97_9GAMM|nr:2Fe-2S iron-sulfur cluster-binding protein [Colwelliaceae bacterium SQ149]
MPKITFIQRNGDKKTVTAENGLSLMVAAVENNIQGIPAICNGCCSCGTCLISVDGTYIDKLSTKYFGEEQVLSKLKNSNKNSRLACQIIVTDKLHDMKVKVSEKL